MTTKTEPSASGAESSVAIEPAGSAEPAPLPSIIVDAKALAVADAGAQSPSVEAGAVSANAPGAGTTSDAASDATSDNPRASDATTADEASPGNGADHGDAIQLSDFEAERFATTFRASWEPGQALDAPMPEAPPPTARASSGAPAPIDFVAATEPLVLPRSARSRGLMLTAVAVAAFVALLALALFRTSEPPPPASAVHANEATERPRAIEPRTIENEPAAAPAAVPAVQPIAVMPVEATAPATAEVAGAAGAAAAPAPEAPVAAIPSTAPTPVPAVEPEPEPEPAPPPRIETVRIRLATSPKDATLSIDGITVPNPYDQLLPKGGTHRVSASAPDHETLEQLIDVERKRDLVLRLTRVPAPRAATVAKAPRAPRPATARAPKKAATRDEPPAKGAAFVSESPY